MIFINPETSDMDIVIHQRFFARGFYVAQRACNRELTLMGVPEERIPRDCIQSVWQRTDILPDSSFSMFEDYEFRAGFEAFFNYAMIAEGELI